MGVRGRLTSSGRVGWTAPFPGRLLAGLLAAVAAGGCGGDPPGERGGEADDRGPGAGPPSTRDSARVMEGQQPAWTGPGRLELVVEVRGEALSAADRGDSRKPAFGSIRDVAPGGNGRILVLDGAEARVSVLDSTGSVRDRLGGRGPGPGELRTPDRLEAAPGDGVLVMERRPPAVHRWRDGEYRGAVALERGASPETPDPPPVTELADWGPDLPGGRAVRLLRLDVSNPSASGSALYAADSAGRIGTPAVTWTTPGTRSRLPEVFGPHRSWTAGTGPDGEARFVVARGDRYEIRLHDASGELRTVIRRDVRARPVTDELRKRALDLFTEEASRAGAPPAMIRDLRDRIPVADVLPVIGGVWHSAPDGRLWVGLVGPGALSGPPSLIRGYDVYAPDGRYLGAVVSPRGFELHRVDGRLLYGSWRDSLEVPGVRIYRLREPAGEGPQPASRPPAGVQQPL